MQTLHRRPATTSRRGASLLAVLFGLGLWMAGLAEASAQHSNALKPDQARPWAMKLKQIEPLVNSDIAAQKLPGAVVLVGEKGKVVYRRALGQRALAPAPEKMTADTVFDAASLTKAVATATSIMVLVDRGQVRLNDTVGAFIPEIEDPAAKKVTVLQLLTHVSGYQPDFDLRVRWQNHAGMLAALATEKLQAPAGVKFVYSDIGFIVLAEIIQRVTGLDVADFSQQEIFEPLGMTSTGFRRIPLPGAPTVSTPSRPAVAVSRIAPTENIKGQQNYLGARFEGTQAQGSRILRGEVHDPTAFRMNGVAGHAGLFTTADDLAKYCQMILNQGRLGHTRILSPAAVALMTKPQLVSADGFTRGLGFDINTPFSVNRGDLFPLGSFGHTGFTGTSLWIDPSSESFVIFLSNRVHPDGKGDVSALRGRIATVVAGALGSLTPERIRAAESHYFAAMGPQIERFKARLAASKIAPAAAAQPNARVLNGIDVLEQTQFKALQGLRIGLVTNHTGRNRAGTSSIDILKATGNVRLVALFSPEHGIRGQLNQENIADAVDEQTGLPIYSLYGETRRPTPEQLKNLDALVFDIQDIGTRFYTYISTLRHVLEAAAATGIQVVVLDRPNPINGVDVEGALADENRLSFVAPHTLAVRHGMTVGELAGMMNTEQKIGAQLTVVQMQGWARSMWFDETNQTWVNPSPNMRSLTQATLYPGVGLLETTNLSVGRGTDTPFEVVGAPWLDGQKLALRLNQRPLAGVRFIPIRFKPHASVFKDQDCGGVQIIITDRSVFNAVRTGLEMASALQQVAPDDWKVDGYLRLWSNGEVFDSLKRGLGAPEIEKAWGEQLARFRQRRAAFLLYP